MIGFLKRLLGKKEKEKSLGGGEVAESAKVETVQPPPAVQVVKLIEDHQPVRPELKDQNYIVISLKTIISGLPENLKKDVIKDPATDVTVKFSVGRILPQLSSGAVKITFRELKNASPEGIFQRDSFLDNELIYLPIDQIIPQAVPFLKRKPDQKTVEISDDIPDVFGPKGKIVVDEKAVRKEEKPLQIKEPERVEKQIQSAVEKEETPAGEKEKGGEIQPVLDTTKQSATQVDTFAQPAPPTAPVFAIDEENSICVEVKEVCAGWQENVKKQFEAFKILERKIYIPLSELEPQVKRGKVEFSWEKLCNWIAPMPSRELLSPSEVLELPLAVIAPLFLQRIKMTPAKKKVAVDEEIPDLFTPVSRTQEGIIKESPEKEEITATVVSEATKPVDQVTVIKMPLSEQKEPITISEQKPSPPPLVIKSPITTPKPEIKIATTAEGLTIKQPEKPISSQPAVPAQVISKPKTLGEVFGKPDKPVWSPNEVIQNTVSLPGVIGAMIVLKDGLPVVAKLPPAFKAEALAGFIPEMFNKISQYTDDLKFGFIKNITIACESYHLCACKSGNIYFVAVGEKENPLPSAEILQFIADEFTKPLRK